MRSVRAISLWGALLLATGGPAALALGSPLIAWRDPVYIVAGFAGVVGMALLLVQPLLVGGWLPGLTGRAGRQTHRALGVALVVVVIVHVGGLWITSPPDMVDALLLRSPALFSTWGVIAMWAVLAAGLIGILRRRMATGLRVWRGLHTTLVSITVVFTVLHAVQIEGTMEPWSKAALSGLILLALVRVLLDRRIWSLWLRVRRS